jgi:hypothetical protein
MSRSEGSLGTLSHSRNREVAVNTTDRRARVHRALGLALLVAALLAALPAILVRAQAGTGQAAAGLAALRRAFDSPPDDARIMMRWWWFGPAVTPAGLERELRAMKNGGIGGVEIQPVYPLALDDEATGIATHPFLSDAFLDDLRSAARTARDLGLRVDLTLGSGWPYGGPQVKIADAAGKLRVERTVVPTGTTRVAVPDIRAGERLMAAFLSPRAPAANVQELSEVRDIADGVLRLADRAPERREVLFFISSRTGMMVKRPAVGAEGYVLNHYDRAAVDRYLKSVGSRLLTAFGQDPPHAIYCDSLEVYESDWTDDFLDQFKSRRGYDLRPLLPGLVIEGPGTDGLRHDWTRTLTELVRERFLDPAKEWALERGSRFRVQGYGVPPAIVSSNANIELPDGEGSQWKTVRASRWAASIGHLYGRPVISSETWTWLHSPVFRATPLDVKAEADLHFLQGINQLVGHGWPYTADGVAYPGWRFYAAGVFNDKNPWWIVMPDLSRYLQRASFLLRQGQPVNDVAVYLPVDDTWAHFVPGKVGSMIETMNQRVGPDLLPALLAAGFNLDFVDDGVLAGRARLDQGAIAIGANRYKAIVLPGIERMPVETVRALEAYAAGGVRVVATRRTPALAPGYQSTPAEHAEVAAAAARLFSGPAAAGVFVERDTDLAAALTSRLQPDMAVSNGASDLGVVHRRTQEADIYFVANTSNTPIATPATFRVAAVRAERWDPMTGRSTSVAVTRVPESSDRQPRSSGAIVQLDLAPYESTILVFPLSGAGAAVPRATGTMARGATAQRAVDISSGWRVRIGADAVPENWEALRSWTDDERTRYFSGVAVYEKEVEVPASMIGAGRSVRLDFGAPRAVPPGGPNARVQAWLEAPVREAVVVTINGTRAGSVWCPPYALDATPYLRPGLNTLRLDVANLAINHMAGHALPDYKLLNLRYGTRFEPQDMDQVQPVPSGLFGPIRLVAGMAARVPDAVAPGRH